LFDHSVGWLRRHRVLLPGVSVLARQVSEVRVIAEKRLHTTVAKAARRADPALPGDLVATLKTLEGGRYSELERMRQPPTRTTGTAMKGALQRVEDIAAFQLGRLKLEQIPPNRLSALARYGLGTKAPKLERTPEPKRTAMLTAVMRHLEAKAIDDALDLFEILMATRLISTAKRSTDKQRLSTLPQLEKASRLVARAATVFIEELELIEQSGCDVDVAALWAALEEVAPRAALSSAATVVVSLVPEDDGTAESALRGALGAALQHRQAVPVAAGRVEGARGGDRRDARPGRGEAAAGAVAAEGGREAFAAAGGRRQAGAGALAQGGVRERRAAAGGGGPRRVCGVRAGAVVPRAQAP
jgi:hypothetical protein